MHTRGSPKSSSDNSMSKLGASIYGMSSPKFPTINSVYCSPHFDGVKDIDVEGVLFSPHPTTENNINIGNNIFLILFIIIYLHQDNRHKQQTLNNHLIRSYHHKHTFVQNHLWHYTYQFQHFRHLKQRNILRFVRDQM